jgi:hypothetical protein
VYLDKDSILKAEDLETEEVDVPEWGGRVRVQALSGRDRDAYEASCLQERAKGQMVHNLLNVRAKLVVRCLVDGEGNRLFADTDANALGQKSSAALDRVFEVAARLSRLNSEDVEELAGNSGAAPSGDSPSASPENSAAPSPSF